MNSYWLNIYKPKGISSAALVGIVKRALGYKVGHCGTLDVEAEGVLPLAINEATKLVQVFVNARKTYIFTVQFGSQTDSGDYSGKIISTTTHLPSRKEAFEICSKFVGIITQIPPALSAIKINGTRSYKLARSGCNPVLSPRNIEIYRLECINFDEKNMQATYEVECSKGTYIRSLGEDIALSLQSLAFVIELKRIRVGIFGAENAIKISNYRMLEEKITKKTLEEKSIKIEAVLDDIPVLEANLEQAKKIYYGQKCCFSSNKENIPFVWIRYDGNLLSIGALSANCFNSFRVFNLTTFT